MALTIIEEPEPLTGAAKGITLSLIESGAFRQLYHDLTRYCRAQITGRSYLISGHRGAGKTTIVSHAVHRLIGAYSGDSTIKLRPLLVMMNGPSLLPVSGPRAGATGDGHQEGTSLTAETKTVLEQITLALHRAVAQDVAEAYWAHVEPGPAPRPSDAELRTRHELAAALEIELHEPPTPARLRQFWTMADALDDGVLAGLQAGADRRTTRREFGGFRELVAVAAVCEAYRRISGKLTNQVDAGEAAANTEELAPKPESGKDAWSGLASLVVGAASGTATLLGGSSADTSAIVGLAGALMSAVVFRLTGSRKHERKEARHYRFLADLSVETLDRSVPTIIDRLLEAGLAPIFVVDELDKVVNLSSRIQGMVNDLKKLVAENAFFVFITDRWYFESINTQSSTSGYPVEYTFFSERHFIVFQPNDLRDYIERVIQPTAPDPRMAAGLGPQIDEADRKVLSYVVMHRSRMHAIDLRREIGRLRNENGQVVLAPGQVRSERPYRFDTCLQLAIELTLGDAELRADLEKDPGFRRLAYDAMYFPSRQWLEDWEEPVDLTDAAAEDFRDYLIARMGRDNELSGVDAAGGTFRRGATLDVAQEVADALRRQVNVMMGLVADPELLRARAVEFNTKSRSRVIEQVVLDALRTADPVLVKRDESVNRWYWQYSPSGNPASEVVIPAPAAMVQRWKRDAEFIKGFEQTASKLVGAANAASVSLLARLAEQHGFIPRSPVWATVEKAIADLEAREQLGRPNDDLGDQIDLVHAYAMLIEDNMHRVGQALLVAAAIGRSLTSGSGAQQIEAGLTALSAGFHLLNRDDLQVDVALGHVVEWLNRRIPPLQPLWGTWPSAAAVEVPNAAADKLPGWTEWMDRSLSAIRQVVWPSQADIQSGAWSSWLEKCRSGSKPDVEPTIDELLCLAGGLRPTSWFRFRPEEVSISRWSDLIAELPDNRPREGEPFSDPPEIAEVAMRFLGFSPDAAKFWRGNTPELTSDRTFGPSGTNPVVRALIIARRTNSLFSTLPPHPEFMQLSVSIGKIRLLDWPTTLLHDWYRVATRGASRVFASDVRGPLPFRPLRPYGPLHFTHLVVEGFGDKDGHGVAQWQLQRIKEMVAWDPAAKLYPPVIRVYAGDPPNVSPELAESGRLVSNAKTMEQILGPARPPASKRATSSSSTNSTGGPPA